MQPKTLSLVYALSMGGIAHAQSTEWPAPEREDHSTSLTGWEGCMLKVLHEADEDMIPEILALQSEADRRMCLRDGAAFATELQGEVRISMVSTQDRGVTQVSERVLSAEDIVLFTWLSASTTAIDEEDNAELWSELIAPHAYISIPESSSDQYIEDFRRLLDITMNAVEAAKAQRLGAYLQEVKFPSIDTDYSYSLYSFFVGEDAHLANVDMQNFTGADLDNIRRSLNPKSAIEDR